MADLIISGTNVSRAVRTATKGRLQQLNVWRDGVPRAADGFIETSTAGGRATIVHSEFLDAIERPMAGDEITVHGDTRRWRILGVTGIPGTLWSADVARGLKPGDDGYAPVPIAIAAFETYAQFTVVPPAVLARGHFLLLEWEGPTTGSLYTSRGIVQVQGLTPASTYKFSATEFNGDGEPSTTARFDVNTT